MRVRVLSRGNSPALPPKERPGGGRGARLRAALNRFTSEITIRDQDPYKGSLKRFIRNVRQDGNLSEAQRHQYYESPNMKRKRKLATRERKARKLATRGSTRILPAGRT